MTRTQALTLEVGQLRLGSHLQTRTGNRLWIGEDYRFAQWETKEQVISVSLTQVLESVWRPLINRVRPLCHHQEG